MITFTKEQLIASAHARIEFAEMMLDGELEPLKERTWSIELELARIALASLEAEIHSYTFEDDPHPLYTAPLAPVSVPAELTREEYKRRFMEEDNFDDTFRGGWNACRAAMLQGADGTLTNEDTMPTMLFKPVADLYGLTSPTGGETSFTFDAVEARDFIDGGWSCQEYVELERFQEAVSGNSPVIPDGWVACSERMPDEGQEVIVMDTERGKVQSGIIYQRGRFVDFNEEHYEVKNPPYWMPLPSVPSQEIK